MGVTVYTKDPLLKKMIQRGPPKKKEAKEKKVKERRQRIWAVDFDGTLCRSAWPDIGEPNMELIEVLKLCKHLGVRLILWTSRTGKALDDAVEWCLDKGLAFDAVNENLQEMIDLYGNDPRKICADMYIDDRAFPYWGHGERGDPCVLPERV